MSKQPGGNGPKGPETPDNGGKKPSQSIDEWKKTTQESLAKEQVKEVERTEQSLLEKSSQSLANDLFFRSLEVKNSREILSFLSNQEGVVDGKSLLLELRNYYKEDKDGNPLYEGVDLLAESGFGRELEELFQKNEFNETYKAAQVLMKKLLSRINREIDEKAELLSRADNIKEPGFIIEILNGSVVDWKKVTEKLPKKLGEKLFAYINGLFGTGGTVINYLLKEFRNKNKQAIDIQTLKSLMSENLFSRTEDVLLDSLLTWRTSPNAPIMVSSSGFSKITRENELSITDVNPQKVLVELLPLLEKGHFEKNKTDLSLLCRNLKDRYGSILSDKKDQKSDRDAFVGMLAGESEAAFKKYQSQLSQVRSVLGAYIDGNFDRDVSDWLSGKNPQKEPSLVAQHKVLFSLKQMVDMGDQYFVNWLLDNLNYYAEKYESDAELPGKEGFGEFSKLWNELKNKKLLNEKNLKVSLATKLGLRDQEKIGELIESEDENKWAALSSLFRRKFNLPEKKGKPEKAPRTVVPKALTPEPVSSEAEVLPPSAETEANITKLKNLIKSLVEEDFPLMGKFFDKFDFKNKEEYWDELVTRIKPEDYPTLVEMFGVLETIYVRFEKLIDSHFSGDQIEGLDKKFFSDPLFEKLFVLDPKDKITIVFDKASLDAWQKLYTRYVNKFLKLLEDPLFPEVKANPALKMEALLDDQGKIDEQILNAALSELKKIKKAKADSEDKK